MGVINRCLNFFKKEAVLCIAAAAAGVSMFFVPPSKEYAGYIDLRVLCLLFCLMVIVAGLQECGLFVVLAQKLLSGKKQLRLLSFVLVLLPFFCSMLITNDVALITFVPFTLLVLGMIGHTRLAVPLVVLQTVAANLGSMSTPVGNPQNLFLYAKFHIPAGGFFSVMLPLTLVSLAALTAASLCVKGETIEVRFPTKARLQNPRLAVLFAGLFLLCLLTVFHLLPYELLTCMVVLCLLLFDRPLFAKADYGLLLTFVCFFIFAGNIGRIAPVQQCLAGWMEKSAWITSALTSQVISNVPAAVLLSGFSDHWQGLLIGTNLGGLGTPIASLASLISLKLYMREPGARPLRYLACFTLANIAGLALLCAVVLL